MGGNSWTDNIKIGLLILGVCFGIISQAHASSLNDYFYETWTSRDGLPHNSINAITQTQDGYLWFATWEGIARFNGHEFKHFTRGPDSGLIDSGVRALYADKQGGLLAGGVRGGLTYHQHYTWQPLPPIKNLVNAVLRQPDGGIWIGLEGEGLFFREQSNASDQTILPELSVYQISRRGNGTILAATSKGLYSISPEGIVNLSLSYGLKGSPVYDALEDANGRIVFGGKNGAWFYQNGKLTPVHPSLSGLFVTRILADDQGHYWFGTINKGVYRLAGNELTIFDEHAGLSHNRVLSMYQDREHSIWIGTNGGLTRLHQAPFTIWDKKRGLTGDYIRTVLALASGDIVVGSSRGLSVIHQQQIRNYQPQTSNLTNSAPLSVLSLAPRAGGGVWVGTYNQGLFRFDHQTLQPVPLNDLPSNEIRALMEDKQGRLWVGTTAGLVRYSDDGEHRLFTTKDGLPDNYVMALTEDKLGHVWVGTGVGVAMIEQDRVRSLDLQTMDEAEYIFGFYAQDQYMWMTTDRGLVRYRFSDGKLSLVGRNSGLPIDKLFQIVPDSNGYFWLTSNRGIWRIAMDQAHAIADGKESRLRFEHYNERDGMRTAQANGGSSPAATVDASGTLWFATAKGVASTNPQHYSGIEVPSFPTVIEKVRVDQTWLDPNEKQPLELPAGTQQVSFDYVGLGYLSTQHIRYRTKLEGLESEWTQRETQGTADYTNLSPGEYRFVVKAYYLHHPTHVNQTSISFRILPHWWQRKSVQFIFTLLLFASIGLSVWWRLHLLKLSEQRLKREVMQKTQALQKQAAAFEQQAREDQLTGLKNRRAFDEWIDKNLSCSQPAKALSVALMDIDYFKKINDNHTHLIGDQVLQQVASDIRQTCPDDCFVARWGGEEFVLGFVGWQPNDVHSICEAIRLAVNSRNYAHVADQLSVSISTGIVNADSNHDFEQLLRCADKALLQVKASGRNGICVYDSAT
ncbi:ligand-binding sensor domain-containing diguanylate cyclase [Vibrio sp. CAU 1672]|uniref:ligand-binding sensor domain-containing diguanylate cyclase n=1 Tax=Vibrio sp. CAU 1672 TaxID=3032594 RepID=UPI0023DC7972|nr:ligand-binding sensor domain-containing diguanylate cyclase [Vibrio sp. CAU 1672]MDF2153433.1 two-component regulator propeller domain-containing protein [Vibrio sp. CAU 1672]